ncbi:MAG: sialate O-acetylesterase [Marinilabiliales bacterium]|nr:sialate O-acetylesterase [Marinilabiliales bacterium]
MADADGKWRVVFDPLKAGGTALEMTVRGAKGPAVVVKDILVGEVWLCSGQSNMEMSMTWLPYPAPDALRADNPNMRLFKLPRRTSDRPQDDVDAKWDICAPDVVRTFSTVGYYFGLELHKRLGVPVGLIDVGLGRDEHRAVDASDRVRLRARGRSPCSRGRRRNTPSTGTLSPRPCRRGRPGSRTAGRLWPPSPCLPPAPAPRLPANPYDNPQAPTTLYNGMIHALTPFAIRGAIWYQGEANRNDGLFYEKKMEALIDGWRAVWQLGDFPFYYVQLAPFNYGYDRETPAGDSAGLPAPAPDLGGPGERPAHPQHGHGRHRRTSPISTISIRPTSATWATGCRSGPGPTPTARRRSNSPGRSTSP